MIKPTHRKRLWLCAALLSAMVVMWAISAIASEDKENPLRLESIWETPKKGERVFAEGFPPVELREILADTSIRDEDKEWLVNQIRHWAAYRTKKLWLDDGSTMDIPVVKPGDKVRTFTVYKSRNLKYWLVRAMRIEGPEIPPKPEPDYPGSLTVELAEAMGIWHGAQRQQKTHWREAFMDVDGRIYWEKEFGPYDTYLEDSWIGDVGVYISDDGEVVVKKSLLKAWFCGKDGECVERDGFGHARAALSADGSTFVVHGGSRFSNECGLCVFDNMGERKWCSEAIEGRALSPVVVGVADSGQASVFSVGRQDPGTHPQWSMHLVGSRGETVKSYQFGEHPRAVGFLPGGDRLVVATARSVRMLDVHNGNELWRHKTASGWPGRMERMHVRERVTVVSAYGDARCTTSKGELYVFGCDGKLLLIEKRPTSEVVLSPNGAFLLEKAGGLKFSRLAVRE